MKIPFFCDIQHFVNLQIKFIVAYLSIISNESFGKTK